MTQNEAAAINQENDKTVFWPTLNKTGFSLTHVDAFSKSFISYATTTKGPVLEIGAGYGAVTLEALRHRINIYCNDIEPKHLDLIEKSVVENKNLLTLVPGAFPHEIHFDDNFFDAILINRVIHLFDGDTIEKSMKIIYQWLKPEGKVFILSDTPYLKKFEKFIPEYEQRVNSGKQWPGFIGNLSEYSDGSLEHLPKQVHCLDINVMKKILLNAGFQIEDINYMKRTDYPEDRRLDGRESVYAIATKLNSLE